MWKAPAHDPVWASVGLNKRARHAIFQALILDTMAPYYPETSMPFPEIVHDDPGQNEWPAPPFAWPLGESAERGEGQACRVESRSGATVEVMLVRLDSRGACITVRFPGGASDVSLPFAMFRKLTLVAPLTPAPPRAGVPVERVPVAAQERNYKLWLVEAGRTLEGRTAGHVERAEGLYLFCPIDDERSLERAFIPRSAYVKVEFGRSAEQIAQDRWVTTPADLLAAIEHQKRMTVMPMGQSLIDLGLLTAGQLERALVRQTADVPLGEMLVREGLLGRADLHTALACKMGYPLVDLSRFPIEPAALQRIAPRLALWARALPLMQDESGRVIVAVDKPARISRLSDVKALAQIDLVPVLASKTNLLHKLATLMQQDVWVHNVAFSNNEFAATN